MRLDIRTAALGESVEKRVQLAASLLQAHEVDAKVTTWDGTRCHLLIAAGDDAYGQRALALARQRNLATIELRSNGDARELGADMPAARLVEMILARLPKNDVAVNLRHTQAPLPSLCRLAEPPLRGVAVDATFRGYRILLRPKVGRVFAEAWSHLQLGVDSLAEAGWDFVPSSANEDRRHLISWSIESFFVRAACHASDRFPEYPDGRYCLKVWPDLGSLPSLVDALKISRHLIGNTRNLSDLRASLPKVNSSEVNAFLWAFAASDLLHDADNRAESLPALQPAAPVRKGIWSGLARKFGLIHD